MNLSGVMLWAQHLIRDSINRIVSVLAPGSFWVSPTLRRSDHPAQVSPCPITPEHVHVSRRRNVAKSKSSCQDRNQFGVAFGRG